MSQDLEYEHQPNWIAPNPPFSLSKERDGFFRDFFFFFFQTVFQFRILKRQVVTELSERENL